MGDNKWSRPAGLQLARENLQSRVKEEDSVTDVENTSDGQSLHASRPSRLCAQAQSHFISLRNLSLTLTNVTRFDEVLGIMVDSGPIESRLKHLLGSVVRAMMSPGGSIVASLENVNGFLAVYTPSDDFIRIDFKKKGVVPEVMLHIFEEFIFLLGRHSLNNEIPRMVVYKVGKPSEASMTKKATDTLDGSGIRGEYSQWRERFMNYLEEQTDGEAMINFIQNSDQPLPTAEEKKTRKIDRLARSLLIQGLPNDIYSLIDSNETAKNLWDAFERQMRGSEYGEQDRKAAILYEYETFKATDGEQLLDTYLRYLQQPEWKQYGTLMRQTKNLMDINIDALYNILKQNQGDVNDALGYKKKAVVVTSDPLTLVAEKTKVSKRKEKVVISLDSEGSGADDFSELKKITALLAKAFNRRKFYSKPTNNNLRTSSTSQSANKKQEFVKSDEKKVEKKDDEKKQDMRKVKCYNCKKEGHFVKDCKKTKVKDYNYYKTKMLLAKKDSDEQVLLAEDQA
nr:hypothetical protein [Tanacetum cinerariifolium]